jgi:hypothetical protein
MNNAAWAAAGVGIAVGALAVLGAQTLKRAADGSSMNVEVAAIGVMSDTPQFIVPAQSVPSSDSSAVVPSVVDRAPEHVQLPAQPRVVTLFSLIAAAEQYALTFPPGVWGGDPLPQFVLDAFERRPSGDILAAHEKHRAAPPDGWSYDMEFRLRNFFGAQPAISNFRTSIDCRTSGCELQLTDLRIPPEVLEELQSQSGTFALDQFSSDIAFGRLLREAWYNENFSRTHALGPPSPPGVLRYRLYMLERRH